MKKSLIGIVIAVFGLVFLLARLNIEVADSFLSQFWPLFIVAIGLIQLDKKPKGDWWPFILVFAGLLLLTKTTKLLEFNLWNVLWPAIIILVGLSLAFGNLPSKFRKISEDAEEDVTAILGGVDSKNVSKDYRGSRVTAVMGGVNLDISKAVIKKDATISLNIIMGGLELRVPEDVLVKSRSSVVLGGIEDKSRPQSTDNPPVLYLEGVILMGGVEVKR